MSLRSGIFAGGSFRARGWVITRVVVGGVLVAAGMLKGYQLLADPLEVAWGWMPPLSWWDVDLVSRLLRSRWFSVGLVQFEVLFGLWLVWGFYARLTRLAAIAWFGVLAAVAAFRAFSGEPHCGCFGRLAVAPWHAFALDVLAVGALLFFAPPSGPETDEQRYGWVRRPARVAILAIVALATLVGLPLAMHWKPAVLLSHSGELVPSGPREIEVGSARVIVDPLWRDLGITRPFTTVETAFALENRSAIALHIEHVRSSCGCATVEKMSQRVIPPGARVTLPVTVATGSRTALRAAIWVLLKAADDSGQRELTLYLLGLQPPTMQIVPTSLDLGSIRRSGRAKATIRLSEVPTDRFHVRSVEGDGLPLHFDIERTAAGSLATYLVHVAVDTAGLAKGSHAGIIRIRTNSRFLPVVQVPLRLSVAPEVQAEPEVVDFGLVAPDQKVPPVHLTLAHPAGHRLSAEPLEVPPGYVVQNEQAAPVARLAVSLQPGVAEPRKGILKVRVTWATGSEVIEVPCLAYPRGRF